MLPKLVQTFICFSALIAFSATDALPVHDDRQPVEANPHQTATPIAEDKSALNNHHSHLVGPRMSAAEDQHDTNADKSPVVATTAPIAAQLSLSAADLATRTSQSLSSTEQSKPLSENNSRLDGSATQTEGSSAKGKAITQDGGDGQREHESSARRPSALGAKSPLEDQSSSSTADNRLDTTTASSAPSSTTQNPSTTARSPSEYEGPVNHLDQLYDEDVVPDSAPPGPANDSAFYGLFADDSPTREEDYAGGNEDELLVEDGPAVVVAQQPVAVPAGV